MVHSLHKDSEIIYPTMSFQFTYSILFVFLTIVTSSTLFKIITAETVDILGITVIVAGSSLALFSFSIALSKIIITSECITYARIFPFKTKTIYKKDIKDYQVRSTVSFAGGKTGNTQRIIFMGKGGNAIDSWSITGFDTSEIEKNLRKL